MEEIQKKALAPSSSQLEVISVSPIRSLPPELDVPSILQVDSIPIGPDSSGEAVEWNQSLVAMSGNGFFDKWRTAHHSFKRMLYDSSLQKVEKESKTKQHKWLITSLIQTRHYAAVVINQITDIEKELAMLQSKCETVEASNAEARAEATKAKAEAATAKSKVKAAKVEVICLKKALEEAEVSKVKVEASLKKKWRRARSKATDLEKKMEDQVTEAEKEAVATFKASKEFSQKKINFSKEAYIAGRDICRQRVATCFLELDLSNREYDEGGVKGDSSGDKVKLEVEASSAEKFLLKNFQKLKHLLDLKKSSAVKTLEKRLQKAIKEINALRCVCWSSANQIDKFWHDLHSTKDKIAELKQISNSRTNAGKTLEERILARDTIANLMKDRDKEKSKLLHLHIELASEVITREAKDTLKQLERARDDLKRMKKLLIMIRRTTDLEVADIIAMANKARFEMGGHLIRRLFPDVDISPSKVSSSKQVAPDTTAIE
ncbi:hypothetical protein COCNU_02G016290 [Cocos nucifera]|uniref:Uncharacterized protein n=1 Tax=Cocos nucifera TaxID=13894 RepID=A0A8K0I0K1_COCNU|nr:hypothetical protein COCNU_02G016290 [Cocos nucifera]